MVGLGYSSPFHRGFKKTVWQQSSEWMKKRDRESRFPGKMERSEQEASPHPATGD